MRLRASLLTLSLLIPAARVLAQGVAMNAPATPNKDTIRRSIAATRAETSPPVVDGRLDDAVWQGAEVAADFVQLEPQPGAPASQKTEARVVYDESAIYVAMRMYDTSPDSIVAQLTRRDQLGVSDWAHVAIDSYYDRRSAFHFAVNPRGVKADLFRYGDTQEDSNWDAVWDVATQMDAEGWTAEFRIPLSQLRFSAGPERAGTEGGRVWGLEFARQIGRRNELSLWAPVPPDAPGLVSFFGDLKGLAGLKPARHLELLPYSVARLTRSPDDAGNPFYKSNDVFGSGGADLKFGLTSDLTLTATINPDFGQVEADPSVVNLTAYETFFPEKRPFFQEGADIFQFGIGLGDGDLGSESLFYSRRIGRSPQRRPDIDGGHVDRPEASTILGATKVSGKTKSGWSIGFLDAVTGHEEARTVDARGTPGVEAVEPMTNYAVARVIKDFRRGQSAFGGIFTTTNRRLEDASLDFLRSAAYAGGLDARHRFGGGNYEVSAWMLGSHVVGSDSAIARTQRLPSRYFQRPDADHVEYDPTRTSLSGLAGTMQLHKIGGGHWRYGGMGLLRSPGFEVNDIGYQREGDMALQVTYVSYQQFKPGKTFKRWNLSTNEWAAWTFGGEHVAAGGNVNGSFQLLNSSGAYGGINHETSVISTAALRGGPALVRPAGTNGWMGFYTDERKPVSGGLNLNGWFEQDTDGRSFSISPNIDVRPSSRMSLSVSPGVSWSTSDWQYLTERKVNGAPHYLHARLEQTTVSLTTRLSYAFTPTLSFQLYAQPFIAAGDYSEFKEVRDPRAERFGDRFRTFAVGTDVKEVETASGTRYHFDLNGDGTTDYDRSNPDFNFRQLRSNAVLRWEWRPGSTLFLVWSQGRSDDERTGPFRFGRDADRLFGAEATNVLMVKLNYWLDI